MARHMVGAGMSAVGLLLVLAACSGGGTSAGTDPDDAGAGGSGTADVFVPLPGTPASACDNEEDDDLDGKTDHPDDPGCTGPADDDEEDPPVPPQCANGADDDADGLADLEDPGCAHASDPDESDDPVPPACRNGADDDLDGYTDFPGDPGCGSEADDDETDGGGQAAQCNNGIDDDRDDLVDLADPGCASSGDPLEETNSTPGEPPPPAPACANGLDDDADGTVDFPLEPGCSAAGDTDETDPAEPPDCADAEDNDADGLVDYPDDPGCQGVGDRSEDDPATPPACHDAIDNDRDGLVDFPLDRGCQAAGDSSEAGSCGTTYDPVDLLPDSAVEGDTQGGRFGESGSCGGRGAAEMVYGYRVRRTLEALELRTSAPEGVAVGLESTLYLRRSCLDDTTEVACAREPIDDGVVGNLLRVENPEPGEYTLFVDGASGAGGRFVLSVTEVPLAACLNGDDDDGDGRVDYPLDPGCTASSDRDEADPIPSPACADEADNDGDGLVDFPLDQGCEAAAGESEVDVCGQGVRVLAFPEGTVSVAGTTEGGTTAFRGSCVAGNGAERVVRYHNQFNARLIFSVDNEETVENTGLYVRTSCRDAGSEPMNGCSTGSAGVSTRGRVRLSRAGPGDYFVVVDHTAGQGGPFLLTVEVTRLEPGCSDGADGDGDGLFDGDDPGCESASDEDERDPPAGAPRPICDNGEDDDEDGVADYPFDVGCATKGDPDEADPPPDATPQCANGLDDDEDGRTDFPVDPGCQARGDDSERNPVPAPRCGDNVDQDNDGLVDYPFDPGCDAAGNPSEDDPEVDPVCSNGVDDDRDGLVDFPFEPGCDAASDRDEADSPVPPVCRNGVDEDEDGVADFPRDPGCRFAADGDEADPAFPPQCANRRDDDGDGRVDYPDDIGCLAAFDSDETNNGPAVDRCRDGGDNDGDGVADLADVGCEGPRDNDEMDPPELPACANGEDDDADGLVDWPQDDGCAARGAVCEQAGYGVCDGVCIDLQANEESCGRCGRVCEPGVECLQGVCGGLTVFEGVQQNVDQDALAGWQVCHTDRYDQNTPIAAFLAACQGEFILYACRPVGSPTFTLVAMGEREVVFRDTGDWNNNVATTNGVSFYFSQGTSIGFVAEGSVPQRNSCDTGDERGQLRMCWHSSRGTLNPGYRCGQNYPNQGWERLIFTSR